MRHASIAASKQLEGDDAAITGTGDSPLRPNSTINRSPCSGFVGMPVDGPARWMSQMTSGSSSWIARPIVSAFNTTPGPADVVTPSAPPNDAPSAAPAAAISSSAWNVRTPKFLCRASSSSTADAGVIGYAPRNKGRPDFTDAAMRPYASAWLPVMLRYRPGFIAAGLTSYCTANASVVSPNAYPVWKALTFAAAISGRFANFDSRKAIVPSVGR